jgi:anthranilate phosphoribosyltransferase
MHNINEKLFKGKNLTQAESFESFSQIIKGNEDPVNITALLVALKIKGEHPNEVSGAAKALRQEANRFDKPNYYVADSCGTGGSGKHTLNISTLVAFIAAVKGMKMVKHGNRSVSSQCGSADVLEKLGVNITMSSKVARDCLDKLGVTFLFAPNYHTGIKHVMPVRNHLKTRTIFNLLGPLINPAQPEYQLMGVYAPEHCFTAAETLRLSGCKNAMVVHSCGCDEITLSGTTHVAHLKNGEIEVYDLTPENFGLTKCDLSELIGGTPEENAVQFKKVLQGKASTSVNTIIAANAGALFYLSGFSLSLKQGVLDALEIIESGHAFEKLLALVENSQENENSIRLEGAMA